MEKKNTKATMGAREDGAPEPLVENYDDNVHRVHGILRPDATFDLIERTLLSGGAPITFFYIEGFTKDAELQKLMQAVIDAKSVGSAEEFSEILPFVEVEKLDTVPAVVTSVLSGQTVLLAPSFGALALAVDLRLYPARPTSEPESDRVMQGARDGFVETLAVNTALLRRRVRDPRLAMEHFNLGGSSRTDVILCYMRGMADERYVEKARQKLSSIRPKSVTLGFQSLAESLIRSRWYNPFPKIRTTERPDTAAAQVLEGDLLVFCDTSPQVMILPTSVFDYLQQTDDYYFPPLTGAYLRIVRTFILLFSLVCTPLWYLALSYADLLPEALAFLLPKNPGALPIIAQLFLAEVAIDGLKIASMNTPDMLSNSLSVVGALVLGDFAVTVGWLCPDVILYMAFVAIANFAQQNHELGYAIKFLRCGILALTALFRGWGFLAGILLSFVLVATNRTFDGAHGYLYPLIPWNGRAMRRLLLRTRKEDFDD